MPGSAPAAAWLTTGRGLAKVGKSGNKSSITEQKFHLKTKVQPLYFSPTFAKPMLN